MHWILIQALAACEKILNTYISDFDDEIKPLCPLLIKATIGVYKNVSEGFLPTPTKAHYLFNLRDMAKVVQGMTRANPLAFGSGHLANIQMRLLLHRLVIP